MAAPCTINIEQTHTHASPITLFNYPLFGITGQNGINRCQRSQFPRRFSVLRHVSVFHWETGRYSIIYAITGHSMFSYIKLGDECESRVTPKCITRTFNLFCRCQTDPVLRLIYAKTNSSTSTSSHHC